MGGSRTASNDENRFCILYSISQNILLKIKLAKLFSCWHSVTTIVIIPSIRVLFHTIIALQNRRKAQQKTVKLQAKFCLKTACIGCSIYCDSFFLLVKKCSMKKKQLVIDIWCYLLDRTCVNKDITHHKRIKSDFTNKYLRNFVYYILYDIRNLEICDYKHSIKNLSPTKPLHVIVYCTYIQNIS